MIVPKLTIDANCVINLFEPVRDSATSVDELRVLIRYAMENKVEIAITTRLEADLLRDRNEERRANLLAMLEMFPIVSTVGRWDVSCWDGDLFADQQTARLNDEIQQIVFPGLTPADARYSNKINDVDNVAIHAYSDAPSVEALALAKGAVKISDVTDADAFDYSSRARTANLGQVILWRNVNGLYGATRVVGIKDDSRGDAINELIFEYVLLPDGSRDFSKDTPLKKPGVL